MGVCIKILVFLHIAALLAAGVFFWAVLTDKYPPVPDVPKLENVWFGDEPAQENTAIKPFKIQIPEAVS